MDQYEIQMLPPGEQWRQCLDKSLMGLEMAWFGGGGGGGNDDAEDRWEEQADLAHKQNMNSYQYNKDSADRAYNHQIVQNVQQRRQMLEQHAYQTKQHEQQWMYANALKEQELNAQRGAYNKSEKLYGYQLGMNQLASDMAMEAQRAQTEERFKELTFEADRADVVFGSESEKLALQQVKTDVEYAGTKADLATKRQEVDLDIYGKRTAASRKKQELTIQEQTKRGGVALESVENAVKSMQAAGQAKARGQAGRSTKKQYQAISAASGRLQAAKAYELNRSDLATRLAIRGVGQTLREQEHATTLAHSKIGIAGIQAEAGYDISKLEMDNATNHLNEMFDIGKRERGATSLSIQGAHGRSMKKIVHDQYEANVRADFARMSEPSMGVPIPKPLEIPLGKIIDPPFPIHGEAPVWGAGMGAVPQEQTGGSGIGGMIGSAAGIAMAATPFFGPLAVPAMGLLGGIFDMF